MFQVIDSFLYNLVGEGFLGNFLRAVTTLAIILIISYIIYFIFTLILKRLTTKAKSISVSKIASSIMSNKIHKHSFALIFFFLLSTYAGRFMDLTGLVSTISLYGSIISLMLIIGNLTDVIVDFYSTKQISKKRPIKGPLQIAKFLVYCVFGLIMIATLINQSPLVLISGIGTFTAILSIVFKDALLGLVAGIQITSENLLQIGDWISIPSENVEGAVTDIALVSVKVKAFDNTMYTVPAYTFLSTPFKNWHSTIKNSQRQVHFSLTIDAESIKNEEDGTNLTRYRNDLMKLIKADEHTSKKFSAIVRTNGSTTGIGIPVEVYFTTDITDYDTYCSYVSDYTEKAIAMLNEYGLIHYQTRISTLNK